MFVHNLCKAHVSQTTIEKSIEIIAPPLQPQVHLNVMYGRSIHFNQVFCIKIVDYMPYGAILTIKDTFSKSLKLMVDPIPITRREVLIQISCPATFLWEIIGSEFKKLNCLTLVGTTGTLVLLEHIKSIQCSSSIGHCKEHSFSIWPFRQLCTPLRLW